MTFTIATPILNKFHQDARSCMVFNVVYLPKLYIHHYYHGVIFILKQLKYQSQNSQNRRSGGKSNRIYETYKNTVVPYGSHIYSESYDMTKAKMCAYTQSYHVLPHCKYEL